MLAVLIALSCSAAAFAATDLKCPGCGTEFLVEGDYNAHIATCPKYKNSVTTAAPTTKAPTYKCTYCGEIFSSTDSLNYHISSKHTVAKGNDDTTAHYICAYCGGVFFTVSAYEDHLKTCELRTNLNGQVMNYFYHDMGMSELAQNLLKNVELDNARLSILVPLLQRLIDFCENIIMKLLESDDEGVEGAMTDLSTIESKLVSWGIDISGGNIKAILDAMKAKIKSLYCGEAATTAVEEVPQTGAASTGIAVLAAVSLATAAAYVCTKRRED